MCEDIPSHDIGTAHRKTQGVRQEKTKNKKNPSHMRQQFQHKRTNSVVLELVPPFNLHLQSKYKYTHSYEQCVDFFSLHIVKKCLCYIKLKK